MKIAIVGTGYVGLVTGTCFAETGVDVTCVDIDSRKVEMLRRGEMPIYEPGLAEMAQRNMKLRRLHFETDLTTVLPDVDIVFIAVGTPPNPVTGAADMRYVHEVATTIGSALDHYVVVVTKSTVPVGTSREITAIIRRQLQLRGAEVEFDVASNPEFLKEGAAIKDFMSPDRVVIGCDSDRAKRMMTKLYKPFMLNSFRVIFMDVASAEMTKYAANAMLATRISFINDIANLCERVGADVNMVRKGITSDARIGSKFLYPGCGYGGSCFPKDVKALIRTAAENGMSLKLIEAVEDVNERQKHILFAKASAHTDLRGKRIAIWGLSFKPETDDIREAPALVLIDELLAAGAVPRVYDPIAMPEVQRRYADRLEYACDMYDAVLDADMLIVVTEWKEFRVPSWQVVAKAMRAPVVIDGRNIYDPDEMRDLGFTYYMIGRATT